MKTWFLLLYFWNGVYGGYASVGGPALTIVEAYNQELCEKLGTEAKTFFDSKRRKNYDGTLDSLYSDPVDFRCIELEKAPQMGTDIGQRLKVIKENQQYLDSLKKQLEAK